MGVAAGRRPALLHHPMPSRRPPDCSQGTFPAVGVSEFVAEEGRVLAGLIYSTVVPDGSAG